MDNEYVSNGKVARNKIVMDIKYRKLKKDDIKKLAENQQIKDAFFGGEFKHKKLQKEWDKSYLDLVSYASVGECFNLDYMLYLDQVADYVVRIKKKRLLVRGIVIFIIVVIIAGVVYVSVKKAGESTLNEITSAAVKKAFLRL